ncbi:MAG: damage-inducible protein DinB [Luteitalea sp.]|nr:damage-inducible protein DinB [Luteitalea sp.]
MKLIELFLEELEREVDRSRRALQEVPSGKYDWKPHEKSMPFGYLADMVATIPMWITMQIARNELDVAPTDGGQMKQTRKETSAALVEALDESATGAREAFQKTSEEHLMTWWRLLARGQVVMEAPRHVMIRDTINHWAHHRGQMTVYLRLMGARVPALYGPSADDEAFR